MREKRHYSRRKTNNNHNSHIPSQPHCSHKGIAILASIACVAFMKGLIVGRILRRI